MNFSQDSPVEDQIRLWEAIDMQRRRFTVKPLTDQLAELSNLAKQIDDKTEKNLHYEHTKLFVQQTALLFQYADTILYFYLLSLKPSVKKWAAQWTYEEWKEKIRLDWPDSDSQFLQLLHTLQNDSDPMLFSAIIYTWIPKLYQLMQDSQLKQDVRNFAAEVYHMMSTVTLNALYENQGMNFRLQELPFTGHIVDQNCSDADSDIPQ